jgi:hypothetical protein
VDIVHEIYFTIPSRPGAKHIPSSSTKQIEEELLEIKHFIEDKVFNAT